MGSQVIFGPGKHGFQSYRICSFSHLSTDLDGEKNRICMANAKMKKVRTVLLLKSPRIKRMFLEMQIFKVFSRFGLFCFFAHGN